MSYHDQLCFNLNNGKKMPAVGYGTWQALDADLEKALNKALEVGYRHIDTAAAYRNEHVIGKVLEEWFSAGKLKREHIFITTKLPFNALSARNVENSLKKSLQNLKLDYVDMYLVHTAWGFKEGDDLRPTDENGKFLFDFTTDHVAIWKAMEEQVDAGRAKSIGVSNYNAKQVERILAIARIPPANLQVELHINMQQKSLVELCKNNKVVVTSYASLGSAGGKKMWGIENPSILENSVVVRLAKKYGKTPAQIALRFLVQNGIVVIPKSVNEKRVEENFQIFDFEIDKKDMVELTSIDQGENGRIFVFQDMFPGVEKHPEYPFPIRHRPSH